MYADFSPVLQMSLMLPDYLGNMCSQFFFIGETTCHYGHTSGNCVYRKGR